MRPVPIVTVAARGGLRGVDAERVLGTMQPVLAALRAALGLTYAVAGALLLVRVDRSLAAFAAWHVPLWPLAVWIVGALDLVGGLMLALGALTRPVALLLATVAVGIAMTAGRFGGLPYAVGASLLFASCVFFAWRSGRVGGIAPVRPPGVQ